MNAIEAIRPMSDEDTRIAVEAIRSLQAGDNDGTMAALATMTTDGLTKLETALMSTMTERKGVTEHRQ